jgi:3,4-dihydroxy-9,10-secoandrosta-1,3,5(10)-triene-9,17-dione 4,5-dioxygenase
MVMDIRALGYIGIDVADVDRWRGYAEMLGTMVIAEGSGLRMRIDERPFRVAVEASESSEGLAFAGWELPDAKALTRATAELNAAGFTTEDASPDELVARRVRGLVHTKDPGGFDLELFHGPIHDHELLLSPSGVSGFVTGPNGLGHIVLGTPNLSEQVDYYTNVLGFRVSDYWKPGGDTDVVFMRCNQRHHSLALVPAPEPVLYHFMLEALTLDDVGYTLDRHHDSGTGISMGIGKHTNDQMVSFYSQSPSGFEVEFGFGGLLVDEDTWTVNEITKPSFWGHHPPTASQ